MSRRVIIGRESLNGANWSVYLEGQPERAPMRILSRSLLVVAVAGTLAATMALSGQSDFSITVSTAANTVKAGSDLKIDMIETNLMDHPIQVGLIAKANIAVLDSNGNPVRDVPPVLIKHPAENGKPEWMETYLPQVGTRLIDLGPGKTIKDQFVVTKLFDLSNPGKYTIQVRSLDEKTARDGDTRDGVHVVTGTLVKSNTLTVTVTPAD